MNPATPASGSNEMGWGSDVAAQLLRDLGFRYVALNPGASFRGLHDSLVNYLGDADPKMVLCLHEEHAVGIAHGWAKVTGEPMAVVLHSNVGLMHGSMAIFNAWCDRVPMLILGATGPVDAARRRPWIDWIHTATDQAALVRSFIKWDNQPASVPAMVEALLRADRLTRSGPPAPVYVCLDAALQEDPLQRPPALPQPRRFAAPAPSRPDAAALAAALQQLQAAERPVILAGKGARTTEAWTNRVRLAERLGAAVLTDLKAGAAFPTDHPLHAAPMFNFLSGPARAVLQQADLLLALDWIDLGGTLKQAWPAEAPPVPVIEVTLDHQLHHGASMEHQGLAAVDHPLAGDPDATVAELLAALGPAPARAGWHAASSPPPPAAPARHVTLSAVAAALRDAVEDPDLVSFVALSRGWPDQAWPLRHPLSYLGKDGGGGVGSGLGISIGAALALRGTGRLPVAVLGDGDVSMGINALWTAAHDGIPLLILVNNNRSYLNDELHQEGVARRRGRDPSRRWIGQRMDDPALDFAKLAEAQGVEAIGPVSRPEDVPAAIARALQVVQAGRPCLIDLLCPPGAERDLNEASGGRPAP
ncbi:thiamine pyrophosphate-binding protein [Roseomonas sp. BN140053]|uniref:thiamine pyrophosphate-binding protein n=1 Tax=Roseomonas sp. BN140053 TaxID=3391898 RepID=UPI0039EB5AC5